MVIHYNYFSKFFHTTDRITINDFYALCDVSGARIVSTVNMFEGTIFGFTFCNTITQRYIFNIITIKYHDCSLVLCIIYLIIN